MINTYQYDNEIQLSAHFNSREFRCKCGKNHEFKIDSELVDRLEKLYSALKCSKIIISSGFRCTNHDKAVGGNGNGQHTKGTAADICCYGQNGEIISTKLVCCKAQDIGFTGIANINSTYTYAHVDVRSGSKWYGNEIYGNNTVTTDFYQYYGIKKDDNDVKSALNGIDVSLYQNTIDWGKVIAGGIDYAIIKAGQKDYTDPKFEQNYAAATAAGMPIGAYWYGEATTVDAAIKEADCFIERLKGKKFAYPVYYDVEGKMLNLDKGTLTSIVKAFMSRVESAGYWVGLYMSGCPMHDMIDMSVLSRYAVWVADTRGTKPTYLGVDYGMWQYSWKGKIDGITGDVDLDYCYVDYPSKIKAKGLNGFGSPKTPDDTSDHTNNDGDTDQKPSNNVDDDDDIDVEITIDGKKYEGTLTEKK